MEEEIIKETSKIHENDEILKQQQKVEGQMNHDKNNGVLKDKENAIPNMLETNGEINNKPQRRHDEPSELSFEICE